ncbi:MAG: methyltransferase domain-containing protein [Chloroflexota bacterium]|nr:methyltransferase domain-containing protein [Chloroflexota bacterium]
MSHTEPVAETFTRYAPYYDAEQQRNLLARWTRARSLQVLRRTFRARDRVLEIGCGTGEEALYLAARGVEVVATDASEGMIEVLCGKLGSADIDESTKACITPRVIAARDLGRLVDECGRFAFAGAYSSFGPLNCEPNLRLVITPLAELVQPGGRLVISLLNRYCAWETIWHLARLKPGLAFRRWGGHAQATVRAEWGDQRVPVFYWTPAAVERLFSTHFVTTRRSALTWLLPPPYLERLVSGRPALFRRLAALEVRLAHRWPFNCVGDHVLLEMIRKTP